MITISKSMNTKHLLYSVTTKLGSLDLPNIKIFNLNVIAVPEWDDVEVSGVEPGHVHGEVVGLGAAVDEVDALQRLGQSLRQTLGVFVDFRLYDKMI